MEVVKSVNDVPIRVTEERWLHVTEEHTELAGCYYEVLETIQNPDSLYEGKTDELIAIRQMEKDKYLIVIYKEMNPKDGFLITSFLTKRLDTITKRKRVWQR